MMNSTTNGDPDAVLLSTKRKSVRLIDIIWMLYLIILLPVAYYMSVYLLENYTYGDQTYYTRFYESLKGESLLQVPYQQLLNTGSSEPLFGFVIWVGANFGFEKVVFISLINTLFTLVTGLALRKLGANIFIATLIFTNYYFLVLFTSAERLKFSYFAMMLFFLSSRKLKIFFFLIAPLFHFQTVINYASWFSSRFFRVKLSAFKKRSFQLKMGFYFIVGVFSINYVLTRYGIAVSDKLAYYFASAGDGAFGIAKGLLLIISGFLMRIRFVTVFSYFLPILFAAALLGPERVNMIGFVMFFYLACQEKKLGHPIFIAILLYFSFKSIGFVDNILTFGTGYP